jgi:prepilin-type N-terminal cleavage/methylation domain-containing protein
MARTAMSRSRSGFTLIELLVVIAIIAILVSLTIAGVLKYRARGDDLAEAHDIEELAKALEMFKFDKKTYPPDWIVLRANRSDYNLGNALDVESLYYINRIWPNIGNFTNINWARPDDPTNAAGFTSVELRGHQCLVYFLGGPGGTAGLATNPKHPTYNVVTTPSAPLGERKKYFTFNQARLKPLDAAGLPHPFPYYASVHGTRKYAFAPMLNGYGATVEPLTGAPFVYFNSGKHGYNTVNNAAIVHAINIVYSMDGTTPIDTDIVSPLRKSNGQYWNPTGFQLMSPGVDGQFASIGLYDSGASSATTQTLLLPAWTDNRVNFSKNQLSGEVQ